MDFLNNDLWLILTCLSDRLEANKLITKWHFNHLRLRLNILRTKLFFDQGDFSAIFKVKRKIVNSIDGVPLYCECFDIREIDPFFILLLNEVLSILVSMLSQEVVSDSHLKSQESKILFCADLDSCKSDVFLLHDMFR